MHNLNHYSHFTHKAIRHIKREKIAVLIASVINNIFAWNRMPMFHRLCLYSQSGYKGIS